MPQCGIKVRIPKSVISMTDIRSLNSIGALYGTNAFFSCALAWDGPGVDMALGISHS